MKCVWVEVTYHRLIRCVFPGGKCFDLWCVSVCARMCVWGINQDLAVVMGRVERMLSFGQIGSRRAVCDPAPIFFHTVMCFIPWWEVSIKRREKHRVLTALADPHTQHKHTQAIEYSHTPTGKALIRTTNTAEYFHIQPHTTFTPFLTQWCMLSPTCAHTHTHTLWNFLNQAVLWTLLFGAKGLAQFSRQALRISYSDSSALTHV